MPHDLQDVSTINNRSRPGQKYAKHQSDNIQREEKRGKNLSAEKIKFESHVALVTDWYATFWQQQKDNGQIDKKSSRDTIKILWVAVERKKRT